MYINFLNNIVMKKFLLMLVMVIGFVSTVDAQVYEYKTTAFAYKSVNDYGNWTSWSDWEESNIYVTINFTTDVVTVYSPKTQRYRITEHVRNYTDNSGGKQMEFRFYDQDGDRGVMRLRTERNGNNQLYIEFNNVMWVYNVKRIN